ncbi:Diaphanous_GTPase-binding Domain domain-containing protein [Hexamita inflata]|uniref:Diaphanous GTPase-binding Domain domain-containing protein n=1 Tax=Hexamita inflata TaxID=28002 RepID=A0AA86P9I2_9EUKA|nr:Diaphanous GTPase-binding Domain domain-containing protein [Hexamita inflata]
MSIDAQVEQALKNRNFDSETESQLKLALQTEDQKRQFIQKPQNTRFLNQHLPFISKLKQQRASSTLPDVQFLQSLLDMLLQKQNRTDFIQAGGQQLLISMLQRVNLANSSSDLKLKIMSALKLLMNDSSGLIQAVKQPETILTVIKTLQCSESAEIQEKCLFILSCMSGLPREYYAIPVLVKALDLNSMELFQSRFYLVFCLARNYTKLEEETCFEFSVYLQLIFNNITNEDLNQDLNSRQQFREELIEAGYDDYSDKMIKKLHQWLKDTADVSTRSSIMLKKQDLGVQELLNIAKEADPDSQGTTILNLLNKYEQQRAHDQELATLMENYGLQEYDFNYLTGDLLDQLQLKFQNLNYLNQASFKQLVLRLLKLISMNYNSTSYALEALNTFTQQCVDFVQESEISSIEHILQNRPKPKIKPTTVYDILTKELSDQQLLDELTQLCDCDLTTLVKNAKKESAYNSDLKIKSSALKYKMKLVPNYEKEQVETALKTMKENDFVIKGLQRELNQALLDVQSLKEQILKNNSENIQSSVVKTENEDQDQENSSQQNIESVNSINDSEHTQDKQVINQQSINNVDITEKVKIKKPSRKADTSGESTNKEQKIKPQMPKSRHISENIESPQAQTNNDDKQQLIIQIELLNKTIYEQKDIINKLKEVPANSGLPPPPANGLSLPPSGGLPPPPANGLSLPPSGGLPPPQTHPPTHPATMDYRYLPVFHLHQLMDYRYLLQVVFHLRQLMDYRYLLQVVFHLRQLMDYRYLLQVVFHLHQLMDYRYLLQVVFHLHQLMDYRYLLQVVFHLRQLMDYRYLLQVVFHLHQLMDYRYLLQVVFHLRQLMDYRYLLQVVFHLHQLMDYRYLLQVVFHLRQLMDYRYLLQVVFHLHQLMDYRYLLQVVFHLRQLMDYRYLLQVVFHLRQQWTIVTSSKWSSTSTSQWTIVTSSRWSSTSTSQWTIVTSSKWSSTSASQWTIVTSFRWSSTSTSQWTIVTSSKWSSTSTSQWTIVTSFRWSSTSTSQWTIVTSSKWSSTSTSQWTIVTSFRWSSTSRLGLTRSTQLGRSVRKTQKVRYQQTIIAFKNILLGQNQRQRCKTRKLMV